MVLGHFINKRATKAIQSEKLEGKRVAFLIPDTAPTIASGREKKLPPCGGGKRQGTGAASVIKQDGTHQANCTQIYGRQGSPQAARHQGAHSKEEFEIAIVTAPTYLTMPRAHHPPSTPPFPRSPLSRTPSTTNPGRPQERACHRRCQETPQVQTWNRRPPRDPPLPEVNGAAHPQASLPAPCP